MKKIKKYIWNYINMLKFICGFSDYVKVYFKKK